MKVPSLPTATSALMACSLAAAALVPSSEAATFSPTHNEKNVDISAALTSALHVNESSLLTQRLGQAKVADGEEITMFLKQEGWPRQ